MCRIDDGCPFRTLMNRGQELLMYSLRRCLGVIFEGSSVEKSRMREIITGFQAPQGPLEQRRDHTHWKARR